jgi:hypothetical protein
MGSHSALFVSQAVPQAQVACCPSEARRAALPYFARTSSRRASRAPSMTETSWVRLISTVFVAISTVPAATSSPQQSGPQHPRAVLLMAGALVQGKRHEQRAGRACFGKLARPLDAIGCCVTAGTGKPEAREVVAGRCREQVERVQSSPARPLNAITGQRIADPLPSPRFDHGC